MKNLKIVIEKHDDGYIAYPVGMKGIVVGEGDSYEDALGILKKKNKIYYLTLKNLHIK